jgi:hypothetical protein
MWDALFGGWGASYTLTLIATIVGLGSVVAGLISYNRQQKWQRQMHVVDRMDRFVTSGKSRNALVAIDWVRRPIVLDEQDALLLGMPIFAYDKAKLVAALVVDFRAKGDTELVYLRDCFEAFCDQMVILEHQNRLALIQVVDLSPYLGYYVQKLLTNRRDDDAQDVVNSFWEFCDYFYGQSNLKRFFRRILNDYEKRRT